MATAKDNSKGKRKLTWLELGELLSKAGMLLPDEEIAQITLTKPRCLLLHTFRIQKSDNEEE